MAVLSSVPRFMYPYSLELRSLRSLFSDFYVPFIGLCAVSACGTFTERTQRFVSVYYSFALKCVLDTRDSNAEIFLHEVRCFLFLIITNVQISFSRFRLKSILDLTVKGSFSLLVLIRASDSLPSGRSKGVFIFTLSSPDFCELLAQGYFSSLVLVTPFVLPPSVPLLPSPSPPGSRFRAGEDRGEGKGGGGVLGTLVLCLLWFVIPCTSLLLVFRLQSESVIFLTLFFRD